MQVTVSSSQLKTAIATASKAISKCPSYPILTNFLFTIIDGFLVISASDLNTYFSIKIPAKITGIFGSASIAVPASFFKKILKKINAGNLDIIINDDSITLSRGTFSLDIAGINPDDFIAFPEFTPRDHMIVDSGDFIKAVEALAPHASTDQTRPSLTGIHLGDRSITAADGHKIAVFPLTSTGGNPQAIIRPSMVEFMAGYSKKNRLISVEFSDDFCRVSLPDREIISRLIEGQNLYKFSPKTGNGTKISVNRLQVLSLLELASVCATPEGKNPRCFLYKVGNELNIETGMSMDSLPVNEDSDAPDSRVVAVDTNYLIQLLKSADSFDVNMLLPNNLTIIAIKSGDISLGVMPCSPINDKNQVTVNGAGYAIPCELPYTYGLGELIVIAEKYGFIPAETIPYDLTLEYIQKNQRELEYIEEEQKRQEEFEQRYRAQVVAYYQDEPIQLLTACLNGDYTGTLLKKHYKTLRNFNQKFVGKKASTWLGAMSSYNELATRHKDIISEAITQPQPNPNPTQSGSVTVAELKSKYDSFKNAKAALGIKAASWEKLAEKINAQSAPQPAANSQPTIEKVVAELKKKYGKLTAAKADIKVKAASWAKLAEIYIKLDAA
jgi:DNA polymerase-3 subunit beta